MTDPTVGEGVTPVYAAALDTLRKGAPGLSDTTRKALARSINMKVTLAAQPSAGAPGEGRPDPFYEVSDEKLPGMNYAKPGWLARSLEAAGLEVSSKDVFATPAQPSAAVVQAIAAFQAISKCASGEPIKGQHQRFQAMEVSDAIDIAVGELLDALKMPAQPDTGAIPASEQSSEGAAVIDGPRGPIAVDTSIAPIVAALNAVGMETVASCSGHSHRPGNIALRDGRELIIARDFDEARLIDRLFPIGGSGPSAFQQPPPRQSSTEGLPESASGVRVEDDPQPGTGDVAALQAVPADDVPVWSDGIVTDGHHVAFAQKSEADYGGTYWACDGGEGCLEFEPDWFIDVAALSKPNTPGGTG